MTIEKMLQGLHDMALHTNTSIPSGKHKNKKT